MVLLERRRSKLRGSRAQIAVAPDRGNRVFAQLRAANPRRGLFRRRVRASRWATTNSRCRWSANSTCATRPWRFPRRASTACRWRRSARRSTSFKGIARRQEVRGEARGVKVIDDFGHHPTAIRETLRALRHRYPGSPALGRLRAALEHHAARGFPAGAARCAETGGRRFHFASGAARANPGKGAAGSQGRRGRNRGFRPPGVLRAGRGSYYRAARAAAESEGRRDGFQQRRV